MGETDLFGAVRVHSDSGTTAAPRSEQACEYFIGKPSDDPCRRCRLPWSAHYPAQPVRRMRGVIAEVCDVCAYPVESDQHFNHCRG